jgi:hypothetical protein
MITWTRVVASLLVGLLLAAPLTPVASAQQPGQPATPELFQDTLKTEQEHERTRRAYDAGAVAVNVFLVPGRAITCTLGGVAGLVVLAATLGTAYRAASAAVHEGCGGKWMVTGDDLRPDPHAHALMESY